ncbi:very short patch repair endonuclease [Gordonia amicalis]|uniref:very short patch repair endonuclease n=1 Tax=Gordonia amicalis TaxID=89053 RepID=UPI00295577BE|nr:very short patch repair endonuclease [Gordonia amicalis]MDV7172914.1 very short patch repair endonuclease [Gordonia amicalis]
MADHLSPAGRSRVMASIRSTNTKPELALRAALRALGATGYRVHTRELPGRPDVAFTRWKVAVFVDGAFWHGHPDHFNPHTAKPYWREKIARTQQRDRAANLALNERGWTVLRFWDFQLAADLDTCVEEVLVTLGSRGWQRKEG